ncbi:lysoplasmalogenase [Litoribacter populi]|uniref:lysoplasmalogenase n=1 Tax=Litoribacter populi TaxID=2598460 RepID=UPI00117D0A84|nr:lysoplasmalogenase [Litoribacter populi]
MARKGIVWLYVYLIAGIADLAFVANNESTYRFISKPLLLLSLYIYFITNTTLIKGSLLRKSMGAALLFSLAGDSLLLFPNLFLYGLGAFLMAHLCYIVAFKLTQHYQFSFYTVNFVKLFFYNLPIYIPGAIVYFLIQPNLNELKIPVVTYLIVILMMATLARERFKRTNASSFWQVFVGAILFMVSDGILALNMFGYPMADGDTLVMGTYILAQLLIVMGIRSHIVSHPTE